MKTQLEESRKEIADREAKIEEANRQVRRVNESRQRDAVMAELMTPLSKDKRELMGKLLEGTATVNLRAAYNKYLPNVLNETSTKAQTLKESQKTEITGNKAATSAATADSEAEIINLKKLAGIKN